jgi:CHAD domain-containing protein
VYRLDPEESVADAVRRLVTGELDGALEWLGGADRAFDSRVHETRKHLKRLRALLEFGEAVIERKAFEVEMRAARAAAAALAELRGRAALLGSLDDLVERVPELLPSGELDQVRDTLVPKEAALDPEAALAEAFDLLTQARARAANLEIRERATWKALQTGFRRTYRRARRAYARAVENADAETLHAFRTPEKRHFYQVELLETLWEGPLRAHRQELSRLGELLGEHHDLCLLAGELDRHPELDAQRAALRTVSERRLQKLEREALNLGARLFAEKPRAIARRFGVYFSVWSE